MRPVSRCHPPGGLLTIAGLLLGASVAFSAPPPMPAKSTLPIELVAIVYRPDSPLRSAVLLRQRGSTGVPHAYRAGERIPAEGLAELVRVTPARVYLRCGRHVEYLEFEGSVVRPPRPAVAPAPAPMAPPQSAEGAASIEEKADAIEGRTPADVRLHSLMGQLGGAAGAAWSTEIAEGAQKSAPAPEQ